MSPSNQCKHLYCYILYGHKLLDLIRLVSLFHLFIVLATVDGIGEYPLWDFLSLNMTNSVSFISKRILDLMSRLYI